MNSEKRTVSLGKIRPNKNNPRKEFGDIEALAEAIKATGGMPVNPIVVVDEFDGYTIVDGERRYRALKSMYEDGKHVDVIVVDDYSSAAELVAMLATDDKLGLTDAEKAHGFQLGLVLGVEDKPLAQALHSDADKVQSARKVWRKLGAEDREKYAQVSLEQFAAASEFEGEDRAAVLGADPDWWQAEVKDISRRRNRKACFEALADKCAVLGMEWRDKKPDAKELKTLDTINWIIFYDEPPERAVDKLTKAFEEGGATMAARTGDYAVEVYAKPEDGKVDAEAEKKALQKRVKAARQDLIERMARFAFNESCFLALKDIVTKPSSRGKDFGVGGFLTDCGVDDFVLDGVLASCSSYDVACWIYGLNTSYWAPSWEAEPIAALEPYGFEATDEDKWLIAGEWKDKVN